MKKFPLIVFSFFTTITHSSASLIAHYTFDNDTDITNDSASANKDGDVIGSVASGATGVSGKSLSVTGAGKVIVTGTSANGTIGGSLDNFAISFWATDSSTSWDSWINLTGTVDGGVHMQSTGVNGVAIYNGGDGLNAQAGYNSGDLTTTYVIGSGSNSPYSHFVLSVASGTANFYVDNVNRGSATWTATGSLGTLSIGGVSNTGLRNVSAQIDDVQVYDQSLSASEVSFLFNNPGTAVPEPSSIAFCGLSALALILRRHR